MRKLPPVSKWKEDLISSSANTASPPPSSPDESAVSSIPPDTGIDDMLKRGLATIDRIMRSSMMEASTGEPSRESVMNLRDCMNMLTELREKEQEILGKMSDEELEKAAEDDDSESI